jgi:hypothetical protein
MRAQHVIIDLYFGWTNVILAMSVVVARSIAAIVVPLVGLLQQQGCLLRQYRRLSVREGSNLEDRARRDWKDRVSMARDLLARRWIDQVSLEWMGEGTTHS